MIEQYIGLGGTALTILGLGTYYFRSQHLEAKEAAKAAAAFNAGYDYCAGQLLRGERTLHDLEDLAFKWPLEDGSRRNFSHGIYTALNDWAELHEDKS